MLKNQRCQTFWNGGREYIFGTWQWTFQLFSWSIFNFRVAVCPTYYSRTYDDDMMLIRQGLERLWLGLALSRFALIIINWSILANWWPWMDPNYFNTMARVTSYTFFSWAGESTWCLLFCHTYRYHTIWKKNLACQVLLIMMGSKAQPFSTHDSTGKKIRQPV